jgi:hypothetical protein
MPRQKKMPCDVFRIVHPDWGRIDEEARESIWETLRDMHDFIGIKLSRKGFIGVNRVANTVAGFYVQEDLREGLRGDRPKALTRSQDANFEKLFFALALDAGHVILQRTKLYGYVSMNYTTMRREFESMLALVLSKAGITIARVQLTKFYRRRSQDEMRKIFFGNPALEVNVTELHRKTVPDYVHLANPEPGEEIFLKRIFNGDFEHVDEETLKAAPGKDLRVTKTAKAAVSAGTVTRTMVRSHSGEPELFETEQDEKIEVPVDDSKESVTSREIRDVIEIVERRITIPTRLMTDRQSLSDLPLFTHLEDKSE